jgi:tetratricopeptide (TPR) repeat protein
MFIFSRYFQIGIILWLSVVSVQSDQVLSFADQLFSAGQSEEAITEYKRFVFFHSEDRENDAGYAFYKMGLAYRDQSRWDEAIAMFQKSIQIESLDRVRDERRIALGVTLIACGRFGEADFLLLKVEMYSPFIETKKRSSFFRGICNLYTSNWAEARIAFQSYFLGQRPELKDLETRVDDFLSQAPKIKYKSPGLANVLSTVVPGSGQIYAADWAGGINAFIINAATGYLVVHDLAQKQILDAIFNALFLFERFYSGNRQNSKEAVARYNQNLNRQFASKILKFLERENK